MARRPPFPGPVHGLALLALLGASTLLAQPAGTIQDEALVAPYTLPDPLRFQDGRPVRDAADWREGRRPEVLRLFEEQVYGRAPAGPATLRSEVVETDSKALGGRATRRQVRVLLDDRGGGFDLLLYVPNGAARPVPAFLVPNFGGNHTVHPDPAIRLSTSWVRDRTGGGNHRATEASRGIAAGSFPVERILDRGYALATFTYADFEPDHREGLRDGVRARFGPGPDALGPSDWGAIAAWAWGLSRALDFLETDRDVDARRVAVLGHSRLGKTALWAGARDERFAMVVSNDSGEGGAALARRRFGETVKAITGAFPHWFAPRFREYAGREEALPVDAHLLLALVAPRPLYVASATEDLWADPRGEFLAAKAAEPVYRLLGRDGLGVDEWPAPDHPVGGTIGYHLRRGPHALTAYDWEQVLAFADRHLRPAAAGGLAPPAASRASPARCSSTGPTRRSSRWSGVDVDLDGDQLLHRPPVGAARRAAFRP